MIRLQLLGALDLRDGQGEELRAVLAQPKRLALLAYLAAATPAGPHRRDTLLGLFWPELDQDHARKALGQAVHFLRRSLGDAALISRTAEELALDPATVWVDVRAFGAALDAGGVRGEGGVLVNREGRRFMFDDIPENYRSQTADSEDEGWRYTQGDKSARRPPELLTRDHVARSILREVREGRGSPHGGVFLDISWIKRRLPDARKHIIRKLPSMYHQFKQLADIDITTTPMEVGPTTHYIMGGIRVDGETQSSTVPGLFAAGECAAGLHGANRLGGNSLSDLLVFGKRAGEFAAAFAREHGEGEIPDAQVEEAARCALTPFERTSSSDGEGPYQIQQQLQSAMQELVGIVRAEPQMQAALGQIARLKAASRRVAVNGNREYNPGWHTALDLGNLLTVSEAITRSAIERKESRGGHFREDYPDKDPAGEQFNVVIRKDEQGEMRLSREPIPPMPAELRQIIQEQR